MVVDGHEDCPACGTAVDGDAWCGSCGLELAGRDANELRSLAARLLAADAELNLLSARRNELAKELSSRRWAWSAKVGDVTPAPPALARPVSPPEWSVERVRNLLLWTGAALLALSALAFTAVAWTHLGPVGRAALLFAITFICAAAATAVRSRLPATSGALTGLTIALALIDWQVARRAGVAPGLSGPAWWALGTAVVAAVSYVLGRIAAPVPARRAIAVLAPASAVLALASSAHAAWSAALGLSILAAVLVAVDRLAGDRVVGDPVVRALLRAETSTSWVVGVVFALIAAFEPQTFTETLGPAAVMLTLALAPSLVIVAPGAGSRLRIRMAVLVLGAGIGAGLTLASTTVGPVGLMTFAALLGSVALATAPSLSEVWRRAAQFVGVVVAGVGGVYAGVAALTAVFGPTAWLGHAWTGSTSAKAIDVVAGPHTGAMPELGWCAVAILATLALAIPLAVRPPRDAPAPVRGFEWWVVAIGVAFLSILLAPIAAGSTARFESAVATAGLVAAVLGAVVATRRVPQRAPACGWPALLPAVPAAGWAALTPMTSITVLATVGLAAFVATAAGRVASLRAAHAALGAAMTATLAAVITLAAGAPLQSAGFVAGTVAGVLLVIGAQARWGAADGVALEMVGGFGILVGTALAWRSPAWVAGTLSVAVPLLFAARLRGHRTIPYAVAGALAALGATWAWLAAANVTVVEAYTLPAAVGALAAGRLARRDGPAHSWLSYGPALTLALGPTLVLAIARNDDTRAIAVGVAALVILLVGARQRLQAPLVLGVSTLLVLGIDKLGPAAVRLPRWIMLAFAGSVLLWVGTTFERRRDDALRAVRHFERLG